MLAWETSSVATARGRRDYADFDELDDEEFIIEGDDEDEDDDDYVVSESDEEEEEDYDYEYDEEE